MVNEDLLDKCRRWVEGYSQTTVGSEEHTPTARRYDPTVTRRNYPTPSNTTSHRPVNRTGNNRGSVFKKAAAVGFLSILTLIAYFKLKGSPDSQVGDGTSKTMVVYEQRSKTIEDKLKADEERRLKEERLKTLAEDAYDEANEAFKNRDYDRALYYIREARKYRPHNWKYMYAEGYIEDQQKMDKFYRETSRKISGFIKKVRRKLR